MTGKMGYCYLLISVVTFYLIFLYYVPDIIQTNATYWRPPIYRAKPVRLVNVQVNE